MSPPLPAVRGKGRFRYDVRVRTVLGPLARACVAPAGAWCSLRRGTVFRFQLARECDLIELHRLLLENDVDVISIRAAH